MSTKPAGHQVNVVTVGEIFPHPNADRLELTHVGGYQVVIGKGNFKTGDLAVYVQPDSVVPQTEPFRFIWERYAFELMPGADLEAGMKGEIIPLPEVPEKRRRITVKRLRKEYSEGLLMPLNDLRDLYNPKFDPTDWKDGDEVSDILGVTHYVPEFDTESTSAQTLAAPKRKYPRTLKGWFYFTLFHLGFRGAGQSYAREVNFEFPVYDVDNYKASFKHTSRLGPEDRVHVTEKIHGSNARYVTIDGEFYAGSHRQWKKEGANVWWNASKQNPWIKEWCDQNPGLVLYGEVGPTQKGYRYGAEDGEVWFYAFDVFDQANDVWLWPGNLGITAVVPVLYSGPFDVEKIKSFVDGKSTLWNGQREGIVIRPVKDRRIKLKIVSNIFLEKDSQ